MVQHSFGHELARLRRRRGLSQRRLAELLCSAAGVTTVSRHEISRWERGQRVPSPSWLGWLARVLGTALPEPVRPPARDTATEISECELRRWVVLRHQLRQGRQACRADDRLVSEA